MSTTKPERLTHFTSGVFVQPRLFNEILPVFRSSLLRRRELGELLA